MWKVIVERNCESASVLNVGWKMGMMNLKDFFQTTRTLDYVEIFWGYNYKF